MGFCVEQGAFSLKKAGMLNYLNQTSTKKHFYDFLDNWEEPCMMHSNAPVEKALNSDNL